MRGNYTEGGSHRYRFEDHEIRRAITHENYDRKKIADDIALVELLQPIASERHIFPISLPESGASFANEQAILSSSSTGERDILVTEDEACSSWFEALGLQGGSRKTWLCALPGRSVRTTCYGGSGQALISERNGSSQVIGLASFGLDCATPVAPDVYTNVSKYVDWINAKIDPRLEPVTTAALKDILNPEPSIASTILKRE